MPCTGAGDPVFLHTGGSGICTRGNPVLNLRESRLPAQEDQGFVSERREIWQLTMLR